ncbi:hypothetical protein [Parabacteroides sp.]
MTNLYKKATAVATTLLLSLFLLPACSDNEGGGPDLPDDGKLYTLTISLQPSDNHLPVTKAEEDPGADNEYERRLEQWWLLVYGNNPETKAEGLIEVISSDQYGKADDESTTNVELKLPIGTYRLYALANLASLTNGMELIAKIEGKTLTEGEMENMVATLPGITEFPIYGSDTSIPMSSNLTTTTVQENQDNTASITLFRMLGKVQIDIYNQMGEEVSLTKLSMGKFRKGDILLWPYWEGEEQPDKVTLPEDATSTFVDYSSSSLPTDPLTVLTGDAPSYTASFYHYETGYTETGANAGKGLLLSITTKPIPGSTAGSKELTDYETDFDYMRRNDLLKIPVYLSNIETTLGWSGSRMPIGGLPEKKVYGEDDGIQVGTPFKCEVDYAGDVTVEYDLKGISGITGGLTLKYKPENQVVGAKYCEAILVSNTATENQEEGLLIDKDNNNTVLVKDTEFELTPDSDETNNPTKGSFTVRTQELAKASSAEIKLTLVATYGTEPDQREVEIPYTIIITNKKGGNS